MRRLARTPDRPMRHAPVDSVGHQLSRGMHNGDVSDLRDRVIQRHLIIVGNPQFTGLFPDQLELRTQRCRPFLQSVARGIRQRFRGAKYGHLQHGSAACAPSREANRFPYPIRRKQFMNVAILADAGGWRHSGMAAPGCYECGRRERDWGDVSHARVYREASSIMLGMQ